MSNIQGPACCKSRRILYDDHDEMASIKQKLTEEASGKMKFEQELSTCFFAKLLSDRNK